MESLKFSIIIPVYKNQESLPELVENLNGIMADIPGLLEVVFVVDGSPDNSLQLLTELLPKARFQSQLLALSRNFGSFPAISAGLSVATGDYLAVIAADLQEPMELPAQFFKKLMEGEYDLVLGQRIAREDPLLSRLMSMGFWFLYRKLVQRNMPPGGIDVFACNRRIRDILVEFKETNTSLVGLLLWIGFRKALVTYRRLPRPYGKSAWSFKRKVRYLKDSIFAFSDLPVRLLGMIGVAGIALSCVLFVAVLLAKITGRIPIPGYAASVTAILFFGGLNSLGLSLIGEYLWRNFENSKQRPRFIVLQSTRFPSSAAQATAGELPASSHAIH